METGKGASRRRHQCPVSWTIHQSGLRVSREMRAVMVLGTAWPAVYLFTQSQLLFVTEYYCFRDLR